MITNCRLKSLSSFMRNSKRSPYSPGAPSGVRKTAMCLAPFLGCRWDGDPLDRRLRGAAYYPRVKTCSDRRSARVGLAHAKGLARQRNEFGLAGHMAHALRGPISTRFEDALAPARNE